MKHLIKLIALACTVFLNACNGIINNPQDSYLLGGRDPVVIYLTVDDGHTVLIYDDLDLVSEPLYSTGETIFEFVPSNDGSFIILAIGNTQGGSDLWRIDRDRSNVSLLLDCGSDRCGAPNWSPDGNWVALSREAANPNTLSGFDPPRLWTADSETGDSSELIHDNHVLQGGPSWSPDGRWIAFYDSVLDGIRILDLDTSSEQVLLTGYGLVGSWSPGGDQLVFPMLVPVEDQFLITLQVVNVISQDVEVIVDEGMGWEEVGLPQWSPKGDWILIGAQTGEFGVGRQLWRLRPDGSDAQPFLLNPNFVHGGYRWDPTGDRIVFQRFPIGDPEGEPEVILWDIDGREKLLAKNAWLPAWLP